MTTTMPWSFQQSKRINRNSVIARIIGGLFGLTTAVAIATYGLSGGIDDAAVSLQSSAAPVLRSLGGAFGQLSKFRDMQNDLEAAAKMPIPVQVDPNVSAAVGEQSETPAQDAGESQNTLPADIDEHTKTLLASSGDLEKVDPSQPGLSRAESLIQSAAHPKVPAERTDWSATTNQVGPAPIFFDPKAIVQGARSVIAWLVVISCVIGFFAGFVASRAAEVLSARLSRRSCSAQPFAPQLQMVNTGAQAPLPAPKWVGQELESSAEQNRVAQIRPRRVQHNGTHGSGQYLEI